MTGFPNSGAIWFKSVIDNILPYYFWLEEMVEENQINNEKDDEYPTFEIQMPNEIGELIDEKSDLDLEQDFDGTKGFEEETENKRQPPELCAKHLSIPVQNK